MFVAEVTGQVVDETQIVFAPFWRTDPTTDWKGLVVAGLMPVPFAITGPLVLPAILTAR